VEVKQNFGLGCTSNTRFTLSGMLVRFTVQRLLKVERDDRIKFTYEKEIDSNLNFLDLPIVRQSHNLIFKHYHKPM
jgi:hypothetical protein